VSAFHQDIFARSGQAVVVLNVGGISNLSVLGQFEPTLGFDCGPGNALMDYWCCKYTGKPFDEAGEWAATGQVDQDLLAQFLAEPFIAKAPPKSTGRDLFNVPWLSDKLHGFSSIANQDVQATLTEFTAQACAENVIRYANDSETMIVCGGGALNTHLMRRLQAALPKVKVASSADYGLPPLQVEAAAFAWLARKAIRRETASFQSVTGAQGSRVLGAVYPA
jgi:anhydro-N-acetylmuramic acid kinase